MADPANQVHHQLHIANINAARMQSFDVEGVVTVCQNEIEDNISDSVGYHFFRMSDGPDNKYGGRYDYDIFEDAANVILEYLNAGESVLVHCHAGRSRSASTSIAALAVYENLSYDEMKSRVKNKRPQINPDELLEDRAKRYISERRD